MIPAAVHHSEGPPGHLGVTLRRPVRLASVQILETLPEPCEVSESPYDLCVPGFIVLRLSSCGHFV